MTYEELKQLLKNLKGKKSRLKVLQSYITEEKALIEGDGSVGYNSLGVICSVKNSVEERYVKYIDRLNQLQDRFNELFDEMCIEEELIIKLMQKLSVVEYEVVFNRYLLCNSIRKTSKIMNYEESSIKSITHRAIQKMIVN